MKISVRDSPTLLSVSPLELATFLRANGWTQEREIGDKASLWRASNGNGNRPEVLLPLRVDLGDYAARIADALEVLSESTGRSQLQILNDLRVINSDVVRVRASSSNTNNGTIALRNGVMLIQHSLDMMMAAASAAVTTRSVFLTRKPDQAVEYLENVRLGQTERGSYILTLHSPVAPELQINQQAVNDPSRVLIPQEQNIEPFERRVTRVLARSLQQVQRAAISAATRGDFESFEQAVQEGVTSNLCEAVVGLHESSGDGQVEVNFSWSRGRNAPQDISNHIIIAQDMIPYVREAAKIFRQAAPPEEAEVQGFVTKLGRAHNAKSGEITIHGFIENKVRQVKVRLAQAQYEEAVAAHRKYQPVACRGELTIKGNVSRLSNPVFVVLRPDQFDAGDFRPARVRSRVASADQIRIEF